MNFSYPSWALWLPPQYERRWILWADLPKDIHIFEVGFDWRKKNQYQLEYNLHKDNVTNGRLPRVVRQGTVCMYWAYKNYKQECSEWGVGVGHEIVYAIFFLF